MILPRCRTRWRLSLQPWADRSVAPPKESAGPTDPAAMSQMMKDPKMREAMKGAAVMQIEMQYAKLIGKLSLNETETNHFKKLLGDRFSAKTDMVFEMMDASLNGLERDAPATARRSRHGTASLGLDSPGATPAPARRWRRGRRAFRRCVRSRGRCGRGGGFRWSLSRSGRPERGRPKRGGRWP